MILIHHVIKNPYFFYDSKEEEEPFEYSILFCKDSISRRHACNLSSTTKYRNIHTCRHIYEKEGEALKITVNLTFTPLLTRFVSSSHAN